MRICNSPGRPPAGTFRKENGGDFAGDFADLGGSVERPGRQRPSLPSHRRARWAATKCYEGSLVGMGWKDLVTQKSPLGKFLYFQITTLGGVHVSVSPGAKDDDLNFMN